MSSIQGIKANLVYIVSLLTCNKISFALQVLDDYSEELQKKFLLFTTGSDRVPVGGMGEMTFKITKMVTKTPKTKVSNLGVAAL